MNPPHRLAVCAAAPDLAAQAAALAAELALPLLPPGLDARRCDAAAALLLVGAGDLALQLTGARAPGPVRVDFGAAGMRHRRAAGHNELLGRAVGVHRQPGLRVLDATAGLGRDGFVLADLGARVDLCERHPVVAALLRAGLATARDSGDPWLAGVAARMHLHAVDARDAGAALSAAADVIYLDPMFPAGGRRAAAKKEMALFRFLLEGAQDTAPELLAWALARPVSRVVVKRPLKAPPLAGIAPAHSLRGRAVRFDVYPRGAGA